MCIFIAASSTVFEPAAATGDTDAAPGVVFHAAAGLDAQAIATVQAQVRLRVLRTFVRRALIEKCDAEEMVDWDHSGGFSVDAAVRIEGNDRAGLERLLRYDRRKSPFRDCARPPFALEHLHQRDAEHLVYHCPKPRPDRPCDLVLTPLELIDRIAALVPRPRTHRHRYYDQRKSLWNGVLAPNAPLRAAVMKCPVAGTALAPAAVTAVPPAPTSTANSEEPRHRAAARYLWAICCWRESTKPSRWPARSVMPRCASSPSSTRRLQ
jgi:hypothetical protein